MNAGSTTAERAAGAAAIDRAGSRRWPLERVLFLLAGTATLTGTALAAIMTPWFLILPALAGANQLLYVTLGTCPASLILRRLGFESGACARR